MARANDGWVSLGPLKGQNTSDNPLTLGEGWATDTLNVVLDPLSSVAVKRRGSTAFAVPPFTYQMVRHVPLGSSEANDELWAFNYITNNLTAWRSIGGAAFVQVPGFPTAFLVIRALSFNGKLFLGGYNYDGLSPGTSPNRLYVWDGAQFRFVGLTGPTAPPVAGFGPANPGLPVLLRYYKTDFTYVNGTVTQSRSELSPAVAFTNALDAGVRVTRQAVPDHANRWRVWGSIDGAIYFRLTADIGVEQPYFDDIQNPQQYGGEVAPEIGSFLPPPNCMRLLSDGHRILMAASHPSAFPGGAGETSPRTNRMWYTPVLGSLDQADDERIPQTSSQKNFLDIGEPPTGDLIELAGPMNGLIFGFAKHRTWRMVPTGDLTTPYLTYPVTMVFGAGENPTYLQVAATLGETESGDPAIYFFDDSAGLYRVTAGEDVQFVSNDIQAEILALRPRLQAGMAVFSWPEAKQTWWLLPLNAPFEQRIYIFHWDAGKTEAQSVRGGWTKWLHSESTLAFGGFLLHNRIPGLNTAYGRARVPYAIPSEYSPTTYIFDRGAALDGSVPYSASVTCAPLLPAAAHEKIRVGPPTLITTPHLMTRLTVSSIRDFGTETRESDIWLSPDGDETAVVRTAEGLYQGDCTAIQIKIADAVPNQELWQIFLATMPVGRQQPR